MIYLYPPVLKYKMGIFYQIYVNVFWCLRRVHKMMNEDYSKPMETRDSTWMSLSAVYADGNMIDVTETAMDVLRKDAILTPDYLEMSLRMTGVQDWFYLTKSLEYTKIPTEGVLNGL